MADDLNFGAGDKPAGGALEFGANDLEFGANDKPATKATLKREPSLLGKAADAVTDFGRDAAVSGGKFVTSIGQGLYGLADLATRHSDVGRMRGRGLDDDLRDLGIAPRFDDVRETLTSVASPQYQEAERKYKETGELKAPMPDDTVAEPHKPETPKEFAKRHATNAVDIVKYLTLDETRYGVMKALETIPQLLVPMGAAQKTVGLTLAAVERTALKEAAANGLGAEAAKRFASEKVAAYAGSISADRLARATGAATESAQAVGQQSQGWREELARLNLPPEEQRRLLREAELRGLPLTALIAMPSYALGGVESAIVRNRAAKAAGAPTGNIARELGGRVTTGFKQAGQEMLEETAQAPLETIGGNLGQQAYKPDTPLDEGLGKAMGEGALLGAASGGVMGAALRGGGTGAPSSAGNTPAGNTPAADPSGGNAPIPAEQVLGRVEPEAPKGPLTQAADALLQKAGLAPAGPVAPTEPTASALPQSPGAPAPGPTAPSTSAAPEAALDPSAPPAGESAQGTPAAAPTLSDNAATPRRGKIGDMLGSGEVVLTASGRPTTPFPNVKLDTERKAGNTVKAVDTWLMQNALDEARARGDEFVATQMEPFVNKPSQADKDAAEEYLFGEAPAAPKGAAAMAQRQQNAAQRFVDSAMEQFGLSKEEAGRAWDHLLKNKLVKADPVGGQFQLKDGRMWDGDVLRRAAAALPAESQPVPEKGAAKASSKKGRPVEDRSPGQANNANMKRLMRQHGIDIAEIRDITGEKRGQRTGAMPGTFRKGGSTLGDWGVRLVEDGWLLPEGQAEAGNENIRASPDQVRDFFRKVLTGEEIHKIEDEGATKGHDQWLLAESQMMAGLIKTDEFDEDFDADMPRGDNEDAAEVARLIADLPEASQESILERAALQADNDEGADYVETIRTLAEKERRGLENRQAAGSRQDDAGGENVGSGRPAADADDDRRAERAGGRQKQTDAVAPAGSTPTPASESQDAGPAASAPPFDSEAFDKKRADTIKASRAAGNVHLDKIIPAVETMRGKAIYYAHDPKVRGVIRTVDNRGNVYVNWSDKYSADAELASPSEEKVGRKTVTVYQTALGPSDLKDYVVATPQSGETDKGAELRKPKDGAAPGPLDAGAAQAPIKTPRTRIEWVDLTTWFPALDTLRERSNHPSTKAYDDIKRHWQALADSQAVEQETDPAKLKQLREAIERYRHGGPSNSATRDSEFSRLLFDRIDRREKQLMPKAERRQRDGGARAPITDDERTALEARGAADFAAGKMRQVPRDLMTIPKMDAWYRGWDRANIAAPIDEKPADAAKPAPAGKALSEIKVTINAVEAETGKKMQITERADRVLADLDQQIATAKAILECL